MYLSNQRWWSRWGLTEREWFRSKLWQVGRCRFWVEIAKTPNDDTDRVEQGRALSLFLRTRVFHPCMQGSIEWYSQLRVIRKQEIGRPPCFLGSFLGFRAWTPQFLNEGPCPRGGKGLCVLWRAAYLYTGISWDQETLYVHVKYTTVQQQYNESFGAMMTYDDKADECCTSLFPRHRLCAQVTVV